VYCLRVYGGLMSRETFGGIIILGLFAHPSAHSKPSHFLYSIKLTIGNEDRFILELDIR
jgi:hypothetical protein